ncbi:DUF397 domain-containing protein [Lentzea sp. NPDC059081]|uniref:DUF397 domain-containing protein n=1 Tax=Lentzea sp. NPDC059081 TaxID=3346719 RepID=UPI00369EF993
MTRWRKSSYSANDGNCVEVGQGVGIRDSKSPSVELPLTAHQWSSLLCQVKSADADVVPG